MFPFVIFLQGKVLKNYVICLRLYCKSELCHGKQRFTQLMISLFVTVTDCDLKNVHKINSEYLKTQTNQKLNDGKAYRLKLVQRNQRIRGDRSNWRLELQLERSVRGPCSKTFEKD